MQQYIPIGIFILVAFGLAFLMLFIPNLVAPFVSNRAKVKSYECGFDQVGFASKVFNIRFYLVAMLFIIFDLEIVFLLPWAVALRNIGFFGFASMMVFLVVLTIGFVYELVTGALEWD